MMRFLKMAVFGLCLVPLFVLGCDVWLEYRQPGSALGAEPAEAVVQWLGTWAIRLLLVTLGISSFARLSALKKLIMLRRMVGLFAFSYVCLHLLAYLLVLSGGDIAAITGDFIKRPYITAGLTAFLLLIPLAVTSTRAWQRRLKRNWRRLHRLIYPAAVLVIVHIFWQAKSSYFDSFLYGSLLAVLLLERAVSNRRLQNSSAQRVT